MSQTETDEGSDSNPSEDDLDAKEIMEAVSNKPPSESSPKIPLIPNTIVEEEKKAPTPVAASLKKPVKTQQREFAPIPRRERRNKIRCIIMVDCGTQTPKYFSHYQ